MDLMEAIRSRHSVRRYTEKSIPREILEELKTEVIACNAESGLHLQLVTDEPEAFGGFLAHYGLFRGVANYLALVGQEGPELEEKIGYYGERLVLKATQLGLDSCWVALTYRKGKSACEIGTGEKLVCVVALGYGVTHGKQHKSKPLEAVCRAAGPMPDWFRAGVEAALLAPTAVNQQKFLLTLEGDTVDAKDTGGHYAKVDLGIVKYHFEIGAGRENFRWKT